MSPSTYVISPLRTIFDILNLEIHVHDIALWEFVTPCEIHCTSFYREYIINTLRDLLFRWGDNIKMELQELGWGMAWIDVAHDTDRWRVLLNGVMRGISWLAENLLAGQEGLFSMELVRELLAASRKNHLRIAYACRGKLCSAWMKLLAHTGTVPKCCEELIGSR